MSLSSRRILVVDQNKTAGQALQQLVASWGYEALFNDDEVLNAETILKSEPTVIIGGSPLATDDGFSVLRDLKAQNDVPIILLAEMRAVDAAKRAVKEEFAYHYFEQPLDTDKLRVVLDRAIELTDARR